MFQLFTSATIKTNHYKMESSTTVIPQNVFNRVSYCLLLQFPNKSHRQYISESVKIKHMNYEKVFIIKSPLLKFINISYFVLYKEKDAKVA